MRLLLATCGIFASVGALLGALAFSENRNESQPPVEQRFPEVCERYVTAFEACNADAREVSAQRTSAGLSGDGFDPYVQRQLNQLRRELADVRRYGGEDALTQHCQQPQFADINYRLIRGIANSLLEANAMHSPCASAVGEVIQAHDDPVSAQIEAQDALEVSSAVATISATPSPKR